MTIAVTAASGQLGAQIIRSLLAKPTAGPVIGLARTPGKARDLGVEIRPGDYDSPDQLRASLEGVDALLLVSGMDKPERRVDQHRNVITAAKAARVKKIVYTSVQGAETGTSFSPVIQSNRQTEADIQASGLEWAIGRNGIYIEPDVAYIDSYKSAGEIANCAGEGKCGYTTRSELAQAYGQLLTVPDRSGRIYNLHGARLTQTELAHCLNRAFGTDLTYRAMSVDAYRADRIGELGPFLGTVIAGIYEGILHGALDNPSDYEIAAGRPHQDWATYFGSIVPV